MSETTEACPECDSARVYERETAEPPWRCPDCDAEFEAPVEREPRAPGPGSSDGGPAAAALDTPDAVFAEVEPGAKLDIDDYTRPFTCMEVRERTVWDVPFGTDWVDGEVIVTQGAGLSGTAYRVAIRSDGSVDLFRPYADEHVRESEKHITSATSVAHAGEVSRSTKLQLVGDGVEMPEGDDSWRDIGRQA